MGHGGVREAARSLTPKNRAEELREEIQSCNKERDEAHDAGVKDQAEYDRQILTLSAAFLAFSLAFIKDIVPLPAAIVLWLLYLSLGFVTAAVLLVLFSYQFIISGNDKAKVYWERRAEYLKSADLQREEPEFPDGHAKSIKCLNWATGILFGLGVVSMVLFVGLNIANEVNMKERAIYTPPDKVERGANLKTPPPPPRKLKNGVTGNQQSGKK